MDLLREYYVIEFFFREVNNLNASLTGANDYGQLGDGTEESRKRPKKVKELRTEFVISVSCGAHCTAAIAEPRENDGTISTRRLWVWGQNQVMLVTILYYLFYVYFVSILKGVFCFSLDRGLITHAYFGELLHQIRYSNFSVLWISYHLILELIC